MNNMSKEIDNILRDDTSKILSLLEDMRNELNKDMNNKFENAFELKRSNYDVTRLDGLETVSQKLMIKYLMDRGDCTIISACRELAMNRLTVNRALDHLVELGYATKDYKTYKIAETKIY